MNSRRLINVLLGLFLVIVIALACFSAIELAANYYQKRGDNQRAQKLYRLILWVPYGQANRWANYGEAQYKTEDYNQSITSLEKTRQYSANTKDRCNIYVKLGNAHYYLSQNEQGDSKKQQLQSAINSYDLCLQNEAHNKEALNNKAIAQKELDELNKQDQTSEPKNFKEIHDQQKTDGFNGSQEQPQQPWW